jgi:hypothetical protein
MRLTKRHIGGVFDCRGSDGSWVYQLIDIKGKELLFSVIGTTRYEVDTNKYGDWRPFKPQPVDSRRVEWGWKDARRPL